MRKQSYRLLVVSKKYHSFSAEDLDELQLRFDRLCLEKPDMCLSEVNRLELARSVVNSSHKELSDIAIATLAMSMVL